MFPVFVMWLAFTAYWAKVEFPADELPPLFLSFI